MPTTEDYVKYYCALGFRGIRRMAAQILTLEIDSSVAAMLLKQLDELLLLQRTAAIAGWPAEFEPLTDDDDEEGMVMEIDFGVYSDGQPVFTIVDWYDAFATVVHHPDSLQPASPDEGESKPEHWPCGHRHSPSS
jgi:hypothetical protein